MNEDILIPTTFSIAAAVPRFRLLIVGVSGVGKSSLLNAAFGLNLEVHDDREGVCDISEEVVVSDNQNFVVHDSQGFVRGATENYDIVRRFIDERDGQENIANKLHAIWLCILTPYNNTIVLEKGVEDLIRNHGKAPILVVFTQYDNFLLKCSENLRADPENMTLAQHDPDAFIAKLRNTAESIYEKYCVDPIRNLSSKLSIPCPPCVKTSIQPSFEDTISHLIRTTYSHVEENVATILTMAQKADSETKLNESIEVGKRKYWLGLSSVTGSSLKKRLRAIHIDIVQVWFKDEDVLLNSGELLANLVEFSIGSDKATRKGKSKILHPLAIAGPIAGVTGAVSGPAAAIAVPSVFVGVLFVGWLHEVNAQAPVVLRRLMAYIVHLMNIMRRLFMSQQKHWQTVANATSVRMPIEKIELEKIVKDYEKSEIKRKIDREIETFTDKKNLWGAGRDIVFAKIVSLLQENAYD